MVTGEENGHVLFKMCVKAVANEMMGIECA